MTRFRPCIDLHAGQVKQIVGGTLDTDNASSLRTNFVSAHPPAHFARLYREADLQGAHVIMLGPGPANEEAAREALEEWPRALQIGGGITDRNAAQWIAQGAGKVIVTSFLFPDGHFSQRRLDAVIAALDGDKDKLVIDLSCRRTKDTGRSDKLGKGKLEPRWFVAINKWQSVTDTELNQETLYNLAPYCSEFLVHAADNEGLQAGIDTDLVFSLARWCPPGMAVTYAGGGRSLADLEMVERLSEGRVDMTIGSALDCFGGNGVSLQECAEWNRGRDRREGK